MRVFWFVIPFSIAAALVGASRQACAQGEVSSPSAVVELYGELQFEQCIVVAQQLLDPTNSQHLTDQHEIDRTTKYLGTCLIKRGRREEAIQLFEEWIYLGRQRNAVPSRPWRGIFPTEVGDAYDLARKRVEQRIKAENAVELAQFEHEKKHLEAMDLFEQRRQQRLLELASEETIVTRNRRWLASVPFGVGQFQNDKPTLGWFFLTTEAAALATLFGGMAAEIQLGTLSPDRVESRPNLARSQDRARVTWVTALYAFTALAAGGIVEAHVNYVDEFKGKRRRDVPQELREPVNTAPTKRRQPSTRVAPVSVPGGLGFGVRGSF